ncbi:phytanoyl-CoA dioxygenase family protein [Nocardia sp. NPDC127526]|uniref:phytanoyl-CoA dioxygenase family protein n=1 Tax=Nocardia sp. NPDC127526 TaxID=3345393 RepID=UPI0036290F07
MTTSTPDLTSIFGASGYRAPVRWCSPTRARDLAQRLAAIYGEQRTEVVSNAHLTEPWARRLATNPVIVQHVRSLIGDNAAVEHTFMIAKFPPEPDEVDFLVPPHQDGTDTTFDLDPARSVAVWLAISPAPADAGCLQIAAGSHTRGYLRHEYETLLRRAGRAVTVADVPKTLADTVFTDLPMEAGRGVLFDMRLVHRSGVNKTDGVRIGFNIRYAREDGFLRGSATARPGWMPLQLPRL